MKSVLWSIVLLLSTATVLEAGSSEEGRTPDALLDGFLAPPNAAKPRVWWHWMDGNITQKGIELDLEWMQRIGIGGVQNFDVAIATPQRVERRLTYMTPDWKRTFAFAVDEAMQRGLEFSVAGSPGWSESGGPWVKPEQAMKKLVWSETRIEGGAAFAGRLASPPGTIGPFQNMPIDRGDISSGPERAEPLQELYADIAVIAYKLPPAERSLAELRPVVTTSAGPVDGPALWDGDLGRVQTLPFGPAGEAWIQLTFSEPQTVRAMLLALPSGKGIVSQDPRRISRLESSADGHAFSTVVNINSQLTIAGPLQTLAFAPATARIFRLVLETPPAPTVSRGLEMWTSTQTEHRIAEFVLYTSAKVNRAEDKAAFFVQPHLERHSTPDASSDAVVRMEDVVDLTSWLRTDGTLDWTPPRGRWAVIRFGYSLLGITNHPSSPEGTGLEVDKLNREHVRSNYTQYLDRFTEILGPKRMGAHGLNGMVNDSWEAGAQNWTEDLPQEFTQRRGYNLLPWLPALTGSVIDSSEKTERFLWDFRRTLAELVAEQHYATIAEVLHARGMIHYTEAHETGRRIIGEGMAIKRHADVPMSAMWIPGPFTSQSDYDADIRESASVAHIYGQNIVAAESLTAIGDTYAFAPAQLKATADRELANGLNRFVIHTSVHQPLNDLGPGFTLGPYGQWFTRHETWAEQAGAWVSYLARSSYLLQQGRFVADILYFFGEDSNITEQYGKSPAPVPEGFGYDFANTDVLRDLSVENGQLVTPGGMRYRALVLDPRARVMSLPVLKRLGELVSAGATIVGAKPQSTPSLADDPAEFRMLSDALWLGAADAAIHSRAGTIIGDSTLDLALAKLGIEPDFTYSKPAADTQILFVHRRLTNGELYFINNRQSRTEKIEASFRVVGKAPELWHADSGRIEPASYRFENDRTIVPLTLEPADAVFVVFRKDATQRSLSIAPSTRQMLTTLGGPWQVHFPSRRGARDSALFPELESWTQHPDPGVKFFSGTATYVREVRVPARWLEGRRLELDLGTVRDLAEVSVNGQSLGVLWKPPFRVDITDALHRGRNRVAVRVTNTWVNRLIGDKQPGAKKYAYATFDPYEADSPLLPSGLLGPVRVLTVVR
jgi:hypothetical protein